MESAAPRANVAIDRLMAMAYLSLCELGELDPAMSPELRDAKGYLRARLNPGAGHPAPVGRPSLRLVK